MKMLSLTAFEYKEQHDFYDLLCWNGYFNVQPQCPESVTPRQRFLYENNLVMTAVRREIEAFHLYASILLDRIPRIYAAYFGPDKSLGLKLNHEKFWKEYKYRSAQVPYITSELATEAAWLQENMDWYRNRVITHPEGYEDAGYVFRGVKNKAKENLRLFLRKKGDESSNFQDQDHESATLEEIVPRLVAYVGGVIDTLDKHVADSVLVDRSRPRPERIRVATAQSE